MVCIMIADQATIVPIPNPQIGEGTSIKESLRRKWPNPKLNADPSAYRIPTHGLSTNLWEDSERETLSFTEVPKSTLPKASFERIQTPPKIAIAPINWDMSKRSERKRKAKETVKIGKVNLKEVALEGPIARIAA